METQTKGLSIYSLKIGGSSGPTIKSEQPASKTIENDEPEEIRNFTEPGTSCIQSSFEQSKARRPYIKKRPAEQVLPQAGTRLKTSNESLGKKVLNSQAFSECKNFLELSEFIKLQQLNRVSYRCNIPRAFQTIEIPICKLQNGGSYTGEYVNEKGKSVPAGKGKLKFSNTTGSHGIESIEGEFIYFDFYRSQRSSGNGTQIPVNRSLCTNFLKVRNCTLKFKSGTEFKVPEITLFDAPHDPDQDFGFITIPKYTESDTPVMRFRWKEGLDALEKISISEENRPAIRKKYLEAVDRLLWMRFRQERNSGR